MNVDTLAQIIRYVDGDNTMGAGKLAEAIVAALDLTSEGEAAEPWRCLECRCTEYARCDERKSDDSFGPGPSVRCVNCKAVTVYPAPQPAQPDSSAEPHLEVVAWRFEIANAVSHDVVTGEKEYVNWVRHVREYPPHADDGQRNVEPLVRLTDAQAHIAELTAKVEELDEECQQSMLTICRERDRAETAEARADALEEERGALNRQIVDHQYMMSAYYQMLGPIGRQVADLWSVRNVKRQHTDWGPDAAKLSGEERAQILLDVWNAPKVPLDFNDSALAPKRRTEQ